MNSSKRNSRVLLAIVLLNLISTWLHYTDNALFVENYPGPEWLTANGIFGSIILMTPIGIFGYWLYSQGIFKLAYLVLSLYSITGASSPAHYLFPTTTPMSVKMHALIWLDGISGLLLLGFIVWSSLIVKEWETSLIESSREGQNIN